jgi:REP element-mobilizing transposase RayT
MARLARLKISDTEAWYHLYSRISGAKDDYSLSNPLVERKLIDMVSHFSSAYFCEVASFCVLGNHYHMVIRFDAPREVDFAELEARAEILYPSGSSQRAITYWDDTKWEHFKDRLFNVSEFMRSFQSAFARWYNHSFDRRGRFWADRFKSVYLEKLSDVLDCMLYVDLNPVRAGLVERPEDWTGSSLYYREIGKAKWLLPLREILSSCSSAKAALKEYRERLYYRGNIPTKEGQCSISDQVLEQEQTRGFEVRGVYLKRLGYFVDGIAIGSESFLRDQLQNLRDLGVYTRRSNPISHLDGIHLSLREQRSTVV